MSDHKTFGERLREKAGLGPEQPVEAYLKCEGCGGDS